MFHSCNTRLVGCRSIREAVGWILTRGKAIGGSESEEGSYRDGDNRGILLSIKLSTFDISLTLGTIIYSTSSLSISLSIASKMEKIKIGGLALAC